MSTMHELKTAYWRHHSVVTDHLNSMSDIRQKMIELLPFHVNDIVNYDNIIGWVNRIEIEDELRYIKLTINPQNQKGNRSRTELVRIIGMNNVDKIGIIKSTTK